MRHRAKARQLSRTASHRKALLANLATSLIKHDRIVTTEAKAKELRPFAERLITLARRRRNSSRNWDPGSPRGPGGTRASSSWAIARATAPRWLGSNCWVSEGAVEHQHGTGDPESPVFIPLGRLRDAVRLEALGADAQVPHRPVHHRSHPLQVGVPAAIGLVIRVADVVPRDGTLAADFAHSSHTPLSHRA